MTRTRVSRASEAAWAAGLRGFFAYRDLGIREATAGGFAAHIIRAVPGAASPGEWHTHDLGFQMVLVLRGWVRFEYEDIGAVELRTGDCVHQPSGVRHRETAHSEDLEMLEVTAPAEFATHPAEAPPERRAASA